MDGGRLLHLLQRGFHEARQPGVGLRLTNAVLLGSTSSSFMLRCSSGTMLPLKYRGCLPCVLTCLGGADGVGCCCGASPSHQGAPCARKGVNEEEEATPSRYTTPPRSGASERLAGCVSNFCFSCLEWLVSLCRCSTPPPRQAGRGFESGQRWRRRTRMSCTHTQF